MQVVRVFCIGMGFIGTAINIETAPPRGVKPPLGRRVGSECGWGVGGRMFGRLQIHITFGITSRVLGETPLRWKAPEGPAAAHARRWSG